MNDSQTVFHSTFTLCAQKMSTTEVVVRRCSSNYVALKILKFHRKTSALESLFDKVGGCSGTRRHIQDLKRLFLNFEDKQPLRSKSKTI